MNKPLALCMLALALLTPRQACGCTIPVFRYALERWGLSTYDLLVYHRGPLPDELKAELKKWSDAPSAANIEITTIDRDGKMTPEQQSLWQREGNPDAAAWMLVRLQSAKVKEPSTWTGPCTHYNLGNVMTSPTRQAIVNHLSSGASVVFVLLTSEDAAADAKALALLNKQLPILEKRIKLPVQSDDGPKIRLPLPLKVVLPVLVLNRNDPREAGLVRLLLETEKGLHEAAGPMVFPVFGRGRVLACLNGDEFTEEYVSKSAEFLCKDCSCQVKELNPGVDLLLAADWNQIFDRMFDGSAGEAAKIAPAVVSTKWDNYLAYVAEQKGVASAKPQTTPVASPAANTELAPKSMAPQPSTPAPSLQSVVLEPESDNIRFWLWIGTAAAGVLVLATGAWTVVHLRK